ncbi:MAG TPA: tetratricopeptide repeat protein [Vicinamibacterales bacterium]
MTTTTQRTYTLTFLALVLLFAGTGFLAKAYHAQRQNRAEDHFEQGQRLQRAGHETAALAQYRAALGIADSNPRYELALTLTLFDLGRLQEAQSHLTELLAQDPTNGQLNLTMARIAAGEDKTDDAVTYYHRAIYGSWPEQPLNHRITIRFELVDYLARNGLQQQLLPALVQLQSDLPDDPSLKQRVADLFAQAHAPRPAADLYLEVVKARPRDAAAWAGLGTADFAMGDYVGAQGSLRRAVALKSSNTDVAAHLAWVNEYLALDPTRPRLSSAERYRRARHLLELTLSAVDDCLRAKQAPVPNALVQQTDQAATILGQQAKPGDRDDATDAALSTAGALWTSRAAICPAPPSPGTPLGAVLGRVASFADSTN